MDKMVLAEINGRQYPLHYSVDVMFEALDRFKDINTALDVISGDGIAAFEATQWLAVKLANDGELCRREAGYEPVAMLQASDITTRMTPIAFAALKSAVVDAILVGYGREVSDETGQERDLGLEELEAKKTMAGA